jgi:DNA-binding XRE family transcriptional regulator
MLILYRIVHCGMMRVEGEGGFQMGKKEFLRIRRNLEKTQIQLAQLLGISLKAIQSFEQGWRNISVHIERQILFLLAMKKLPRKNSRPCYVIRKCSIETKRNCPAWEFQIGHLCWFINGTICQGHVQVSWSRKMKICRQCEVFRSMLGQWSQSLY